MVIGRRGFSALELAMVLLIIMGMTLVVVAVNNRVGDRARETSCLSNLDQLGLAASMYAADYDGHYPQADLAGLMSYVKNQQVFRCPEAGETTPAGTLYDPTASSYEHAGEFTTNYFYSPGHANDDLPQTILFYDDVPDRHSGETFNYVRIDGFADRAPASEYPGPPVESGEEDLVPEKPGPGSGGVGE